MLFDLFKSKKFEPTPEEKASALRVTLKYRNSGECAKAMKICRKYGISDRDFSYAMVSQMNKK